MKIIKDYKNVPLLTFMFEKKRYRLNFMSRWILKITHQSL